MVTSLLALSLSLVAADISADDRRSTIDSLVSAIQERYVFPDLGKKAGEALKAKLASGGYDTLSAGPDFAKALTEDINAICKDAHFRVRYSEKPLPVRAQRAAPSQKEIDQDRWFTHKANAGFEKVERLLGNVGYIRVDGFFDPEIAARPIQAAMDFVGDTDALIIDVRYNGGGDPATVRLLCSYLFDPKPVHLNDIYMREGNRTEQFWTLSKLPGRRYVGKPVYVLTSKRTGSGAEEFSYDLKNLRRATIVGTSTWGGANPGGVVRLNDHFGAFIPVGRAINPYTKTNWEGTGVDPDIHVASEDALATAQRIAVEKLLAEAKSEDDKARLADALASLKPKS
ncbi:S41 family peptidase [Fimbriimonas ginsengisoli]|uniref:Interphotoreceptor retinoid-binding protein n=1 Tax=Fimbriimonas ginsengisoli Gsoil 348 TaxID=661478 RepID=A0A068NVG9_FIMGI|nr:S41 family peptidase [Fimbriimonas ginsengisoli]AIE85544.1 interphotoreceptor retinoid-binding protein [Fimbriimonas ginsengisoli Gsoil 348]